MCVVLNYAHRLISRVSNSKTVAHGTGQSLLKTMSFRSRQASLQGRVRRHALTIHIAASRSHPEQASYLPRIAAAPLVKVDLGALISPPRCSRLVLISFARVRHQRKYGD